MPFEPERDARKVAADLGLPPDRRFGMARFPVACDDLPGGRGYVLVHWGVRVAWDLAMDGPPAPWPAMTGRTDVGVTWPDGPDGTPTPRPADGRLVTYQLWLIQCYRPGHPLAAERRWHPDLGARDGLVGLMEPHTRDDLLAAWHGRALILAHQRECARRREGVTRARYVRLAVGAARRLRAAGLRPLFPLLADLVAEEEPGLEPAALKRRWERRTPPITLREVIELAAGPGRRGDRHARDDTRGIEVKRPPVGPVASLRAQLFMGESVATRR